MIEKGSIVKGLGAGAVEIDEVKKVGDNYLIWFHDSASGRPSSRMLTKEQFSELEAQNEGNGDFLGDCEKLVLYIASQRKRIDAFPRAKRIKCINEQNV